MPTSKNRSGHRKRVANRNKQIKDTKNRINNAYKAMYEELREKNMSVPDMLNKEDQAGPPSGPEQTTIDSKPYTVSYTPQTEESEDIQIVSQSVVPTPEEQAAQDDLQSSAVLTTYP